MKRSLFVSLLVAAGLAACAHIAGVPRKPEISLAGLRPVQVGLVVQRFILKLRVHNPGKVDLSLDGLHFTIELNGSRFLEGTSNQSLTVPGDGEAVLEVMATATLGTTLKQLREWQRAGREAVDYRIVGDVNVVGVGKIPFERRGELPLSGFDSTTPGRGAVSGDQTERRRRSAVIT